MRFICQISIGTEFKGQISAATEFILIGLGQVLKKSDGKLKTEKVFTLFAEPKDSD